MLSSCCQWCQLKCRCEPPFVIANSVKEPPCPRLLHTLNPTGVLAELTPDEAVALLSALVFQERNVAAPSPDAIPPALAAAADHAMQLAHAAGEAQHAAGLEQLPGDYVKNTLNFGLMEVGLPCCVPTGWFCVKSVLNFRLMEVGLHCHLPILHAVSPFLSVPPRSHYRQGCGWGARARLGCQGCRACWYPGQADSPGRLTGNQPWWVWCGTGGVPVGAGHSVHGHLPADGCDGGAAAGALLCGLDTTARCRRTRRCWMPCAAASTDLGLPSAGLHCTDRGAVGRDVPRVPGCSPRHGGYSAVAADDGSIGGHQAGRGVCSEPVRCLEAGNDIVRRK